MRAALHATIALAAGGAVGGGVYGVEQLNKPTPDFADPAKVAACVQELGSHAIVASKLPGACEPFSADFGSTETTSIKSTYKPDPDALIKYHDYNPTGTTTDSESDTVTYTLRTATSFQQSATRQAATWNKRWDTNNNFVNGDGPGDGLLTAVVFGGGIMIIRSIRGLSRTEAEMARTRRAGSKHITITE